MTEVTRSNFEDVLPHIEETIKNASFIALDAEFTGLKVGTTDHLSLFDSMNERYQKLKIRASSFTLTQIGLSAFRRHPTKNCYEVKTFVFYIRPYLCGDIDKRFMCQASCIDFLCRYDFDFNKVFKDGIPFINEVEEKQIAEGLEKKTLYCPHDFVSREDDMLLNDVLLKPLKSSTGHDQCRRKSSIDKNKKVELSKDKLYPAYFQIMQIKNKYPSLCAYEEGDKVIVKHAVGKLREYNLDAEKKKVLNYFLGFTKVFRLLKASKKPLVGHNLLMDLLLCFQNFHEPLPDTFEEFKATVHSVFPRIFDTRFIWKNIKKFCNMKWVPGLAGLFELHEMFKSPPSGLTTLFCPSFEFCNGTKYAKGEYPHESGYDSYVTGWVFINICHLIAMKKAKDPVFIEPQSFKQHLNAVTSFVNKVSLARSPFGHVNFGGTDPTPSVPGLLHICKKNSDCLSEAELTTILEKYGMSDMKLMSNKKQAIVAVGSFGTFREIMKDFKDHQQWDISQYSMFKHSPYLKKALLLTALGSACVVAFLFTKLT